jgi:hypothetical protein
MSYVIRRILARSFRPSRDTWSNFLQLIFLPVITVGTTIMSRSSERRAAKDHVRIQKEFALLKKPMRSSARNCRKSV